jgi:putative endonuclease
MGPRLRGDDSLREAELYYVYFLASRRYGTIYIGVTNNLGKRLTEHRTGKGSKFVREYGVLRLVYVESFERPDEAITREKQLKKWNRDWKIRLIETDNPEWSDLSDLIV